MRRLRTYFIGIISLLSCTLAYAQATFTVSGTVIEKDGGAPVEFATIIIERTGQWAVADENGRFLISKVPACKTVIAVSCLGYVSDNREVVISKDISNYTISLRSDDLSLESAVVTAKDNSNSATTSRSIDKAALEQVQMMNVSDISSLLPGGATVNPNLTGAQQLDIRAGKTENGNSSFGTAVEVDGIRLSSNASFAGASSTETRLKGVSTNNIASSNVESVEIITGVPSVEYGDMTSGIVKINTKKGKTPWTITMSTSPMTKQLSLGKGWSLEESRKGRSNGVLNVSAEYTNSFDNQMSPYTAYDRKQASLTYSNTFTHGVFADSPLKMSATLTGNLGGLNDDADPDKLSGTYQHTKDNTLRAGLEMNWLLSKSWITTLELKASAVYSDKQDEIRTRHQSASSTASLHGTQEGYFMSLPYSDGAGNEVVMINPADQEVTGVWYSLLGTDDRPFTAKVTLKANLAKQIGVVNNRFKLGADWNTDRNFGKGPFSPDWSTADKFRPYDYSAVPAMHNAAVYFEDNASIPVGKDGHINLVAGVRNDNTIIKGSEYGITSSVSPRFNAKYTVFTEKTRRKAFVKELSFRGGWGVAVKQPSFSILFPTPTYLDINVFSSTSSSNNTSYWAYYIHPHSIGYNPALYWQRNHQSEIGFDINLNGTRISLAGYYNKTYGAYRLVTDYRGITYSKTDVGSTQGIGIPVDDRVYSIDRTTGDVTVSDRTGSSMAIQLPGSSIKQFTPAYTEDNDDNPITRYGLEWVVDFKKIKAISTSIRWDGSFYNYRSVYTDPTPYCPYTQIGSGGVPLQYVGYFYGGKNLSNGSESRTLKTNLTLTTNIPKVRMIISMRLEACLVNYSRSLSERADGSARSYVLSNQNDRNSITDASVYDGDSYTVLYPDYYATYDDPGTMLPFKEKLFWAKENNPDLYNDLSKLIQPSAYVYQFGRQWLSPYFCANFSVTKEIGDLASISFYANNFFNNTGTISNSRTGESVSVTSYIPKFYYGLTLRIKF